jgi:hypothetical protein
MAAGYGGLVTDAGTGYGPAARLAVARSPPTLEPAPLDSRGGTSIAPLGSAERNRSSQPS